VTWATVQNLDGTIGIILPNAVKEKIKEAMEHGISATFGKVSNLANDKLTRLKTIFRDRNYNVYRRAGDRAEVYRTSAAYADAEGAFFDANSQQGSFMSMEVR
jgi:hypothetical protein